MRDEIPSLFREALAPPSSLIIEGSPGKGKWVSGPWIGFFDPIVTEMARTGYYPVLLFNSSVTAVYLSLNQGVDELKTELGIPAARQLLEARAAISQARLAGEFEKNFSADLIDLQPAKGGSLLELYERGHALGKLYAHDMLPEEHVVQDDLREMLRLYHVLTARGGTTDLTVPAENSDESGEDHVLLEERRRFFFHRRVERNRKLAQLAKKEHGYTCQVCSFDFFKRYGALGEGYIEAHHRTPLSQLAGDGAVSLSPKDDFAVVCANCHRMLHVSGAPDFDTFRMKFVG